MAGIRSHKPQTVMAVVLVLLSWVTTLPATATPVLTASQPATTQVLRVGELYTLVLRAGQEPAAALARFETMPEGAALLANLDGTQSFMWVPVEDDIGEHTLQIVWPAESPEITELSLIVADAASYERIRNEQIAATLGQPTLPKPSDNQSTTDVLNETGVNAETDSSNFSPGRLKTEFMQNNSETESTRAGTTNNTIASEALITDTVTPKPAATTELQTIDTDSTKDVSKTDVAAEKLVVIETVGLQAFTINDEHVQTAADSEASSRLPAEATLTLEPSYHFKTGSESTVSFTASVLMPEHLSLELLGIKVLNLPKTATVTSSSPQFEEHSTTKTTKKLQQEHHLSWKPAAAVSGYLPVIVQLLYDDEVLTSKRTKLLVPQ